MYLDLTQVKNQLNLEPDYIEEDEYLLSLIEVAEDAVRVHVNDDLSKIARKHGGALPAPLIQAMLLLLSHYYQNREIVGTKTQKLPESYEYLIGLYRNYSN